PPRFEIGAIERSVSGGDISLIAIEDWNLHPDFGDAFPAFGVVSGVEDLVVVFQAAAELEIGYGFAFGADEFGGGPGGAGVGDAVGGRLRGDGFDGLVFVEVGPVVFEITGNGGEGEVGGAERRGGGAR